MGSGKRALLNLIRFNNHPTNRVGVAYFCSSASSKHKFDGVPARKPSDRTGGSSPAEDVAEMARAGVVGAVETGLKLGEMAKQAVNETFDATKTTMERIRDAVADTSNDEDSDYGDERLNGGRRSDKHVEDLRRLAKGCDLKKQ